MCTLGAKMTMLSPCRSLTVCDDGWTTICDGDTRCTVQNLKSRFSPLHSILREKYRVERFSEGSPTSSLCILRVSEAECQGIKSYARFSASTAQRTNVYVIVKFDTCEADVAAEHSEVSLMCIQQQSGQQLSDSRLRQLVRVF